MNKIAPLLAIVFMVNAAIAPAVEAAPRKSKSKSSDGLMDLTNAINLPSSTSQLTIEVLTADLLIKHEKRHNVEIKANYPKHWAVDDSGTVKQTQVAQCIPGIYHTQNGNNYMGMGTVPGETKINITTEGITINGKLLRVEKRVSKPGQSGVEINQEGIFVNGRKAVPAAVAKGYDKEVDVIQVLVPDDFAGGLDLRSHSFFATKVDSWTGGELKVDANGKGTINVTNIKSNCKLMASNGGHVVVDVAETQSLLAEATEQGSVELKKLSCANAKVSIGDSGSVHLCEGKVDTLEVALKDKSQFTLGEPRGNSLCMKSPTVKLTISGTSKTYLMNSEIDFLSVRTSDQAKVNVSASVGRLEETNASEGGITYSDMQKLKPAEASAP